MGSFSAQALALFAVLAPGCLFFLSFHHSKNTTKLDLQRGLLIDTALFVLAAAVLHLVVGMILLYSADAVSECAVVRSAAALSSARTIPMTGDERCSVHTGVVLFILHTALVATIAIWAGAKAAAYVAGRPSFFAALYGPYYDPPRELGRGENIFVIANVMTDIEHDGKILMYEGKLEEISLSSTKTINYVCLRGAQRFFLSMKEDTAKTSDRADFRPVDRNPLPPSRLLIPGEHIKNVLTRTYPISGMPDAPAQEEVPATNRRSLLQAVMNLCRPR